MIYLVGSLRNPRVPALESQLRSAGFVVFADWFAAGPNADDCLRDYYVGRGLSFAEALQQPAAVNIFEFDKRWLSRADTVVLVMPAGRSGFLELGWALGRGKRGYILFEQEPERIDIMMQFADGIFYEATALIARLQSDAETRRHA